MFELLETNPAVDVLEAEYQRLLGYPKRHEMDGRARELAEAARAWYREHGRPWFYAREVASLELRADQALIEGARFSSRRLHDIFAEAGAHSVVLVAVSAGKECEEHARELWTEGKPDEYFFVKILGSAVVEQLVALASGQICGWADEQQMAALPHFSPGYSGWDIGDQRLLWNLFQGGDKNLPAGIEVMESGMLRPEKSLLAVFGLTRDLQKARQFARLIPCDDCSLPNCRYRRTAYKRRPSKPGWE